MFDPDDTADDSVDVFWLTVYNTVLTHKIMSSTSVSDLEMWTTNIACAATVTVDRQPAGNIALC